MRLPDKVAIVTGSAAGIGSASAIRFAEEGAQVTVTDVDVSGGEQTVAEIKQAGGDAIFVEADLREEADVQRVVKETLDAFGKINILFNNAGIMWFGSVTEETAENFDNVYRINTRHLFLMSKHCVPEMIKQGGGSIINMGSVTAFKTSSGLAAYAAAKGANTSLTRTMALDLAPHNIRVNTIVPGTIDTPIVHRFLDDMDEGAVFYQRYSPADSEDGFEIIEDLQMGAKIANILAG